MNGSRDGQISILRLTDEPITSTKAKIPEQYGGVRMLVPLNEPASTTASSSSDSNSGMKLSVMAGTTANAILKLHYATATTIEEVDAEKHDLSVVTLGHFDEVGSLSTLVSEKAGQTLALTASMDGNINCLDLANHRTVWRSFLKDSMVTAMDCYPPFLAVGTSDAKLKLFQLGEPDLSLILQVKELNNWPPTFLINDQSYDWLIDWLTIHKSFLENKETIWKIRKSNSRE